MSRDAGRLAITIAASMAVAEAINVIWFSGALPWQPYVKTIWTPTLIKGFLLAVAVKGLFYSFTDLGHSQIEDASRIGVMIAVLHLSIPFSGGTGGSSEDMTALILEGVRCAIIIAVKILIISHVRDL